MGKLRLWRIFLCIWSLVRSISLVGESGSGKTSVIRGILGLLPGGGAVTQGNIVFDGKDLLDVTPEQWRTVRGREISMIFQDSGAMMNPTRKIGAVFAGVSANP